MVQNDSWWRQLKVFIPLQGCAGDFKNKGFGSDKKWRLAGEMVKKATCYWRQSFFFYCIWLQIKMKKKINPRQKRIFSLCLSGFQNNNKKKWSLIFRFDFFPPLPAGCHTKRYSSIKWKIHSTVSQQGPGGILSQVNGYDGFPFIDF